MKAPEWRGEIAERLASLQLAPVRAATIVEELAQHLEDHYAEALARGATPEEAYRAALAELSDHELLARELQSIGLKSIGLKSIGLKSIGLKSIGLKSIGLKSIGLKSIDLPAEDDPVVPGARGKNMVADLWQDLRYGSRMLRKNPAFTLVVIITLSLGIGADTAIFSVINTALLQPLPIRDASRIFVLRLQNSAPAKFSYPDFVELRDRSRNSVDLFASDGMSVVMESEDGTTSDDEGERAGVVFVSGNYFAALGATMAMGRRLGAADVQEAQPEVVLSHRFWQRRFGSDPEIVGKTLLLKSQPFTVIGVTAPDFVGTRNHAPDLWAPLTMLPKLGDGKYSLSDRDFSSLQVEGKLRSGVSRRQAEAKLDFIYSQISTGRSERFRNSRVGLFTPSRWQPEERKMLERIAALTLGTAGLVLLIACANVANLMLARMAARQREIAVRLALGASRVRMIRQLFVESLLLAGLGGLGGLMVSRWAAAALAIPLWETLPQGAILDIRVIGYASALSLLTAIAFGLAPAWQATRSDLVQSLKREGRFFGRRLARSGFRSALVVAQIAVSLLLLIGAGLFVRALHRTMNLQPGFDIRNNWLIEYDLGRQGFDQARALQFNRDLEQRLKEIPSVKAVIWVGDAPLGDSRSFTNIGVAGIKPPAGEQAVEAQYNRVSPNYFSALGVPLVRGRAFNEEDINAGRPVVVISQSLARACWPNEDPIGKKLWVPRDGSAQVVGVASDSLLHAGYAPYFYYPVLPGDQLGLRVLVKTGADSPAIGAALREAVRSLDSKLKIKVRRHEADLKDKFGPVQVAAALSSLFGVLALALATMGLYGVMAYAVEQRTHEIGVRMALGARAADVLWLVLRQGMTLAVIGALIGLICSFAATRILKAALYGISPTDPLTFIMITSILGAVALLACYLPARRATKVDPMESLRRE